MCSSRNSRWTFRIFLIFFLLGPRGKGEPEAPRRGRTIFKLKIPGGGGCLPGGLGGGGMDGPGGCLQRIKGIRGEGG